MNPEIVTPPASEPVTLAQAKLQCTVETADDDTLLTIYLAAARGTAEEQTGRALVTRTLRFYLDEFPWESQAVELPYPPLISVAEIKYFDPDGVERTLDPSQYQVDSKSEPGRVAPAYNCWWPAIQAKLNAISIKYDAGYAVPPPIPVEIVQAILMTVAHWYEHRGEGIDDELPPAVASLLRMHRIYAR